MGRYQILKVWMQCMLAFKHRILRPARQPVFLDL